MTLSKAKAKVLIFHAESGDRKAVLESFRPVLKATS